MTGRSSTLQPTVSLFPFLAVLICTMGALIMLLVLFMEQARQAGVQSQDLERLQKEHQEIQMAIEDQTWRREVLQQQRAELLAQLSQQREQLAHLEAHIRELETELEKVRTQIEKWKTLHQHRQDTSRELDKRREELERKLAAAKAAWEEARQRAANRTARYRIVPYPGPNGTTRRPIYLECTAQGVILQPENIVLPVEDFEEPLGAGNPLDTALRTAARYYRQHSADGNEQPYPLLIVRPDGVLAYAAARQAMVSWEEELGYELVSAELLLDYPPPDPQLAQLLEQAIREARQRQLALRRAMPSRPKASGFVVSTTRGGVVPLESTPLGAARRLAATRQTRSDSADHREPPTSPTASAPTGSPPPTASGSHSGIVGGTQSFGSLAAKRGKDWALEKRTTGATAYRRPLRVVCQKEALILMPEPNSDAPPEPFPFDPDPVMAVDRLVEALRRRVRLWGSPPLGGYWQPQLLMDVAPDAEQAYALVATLLEGSGLEFHRSQP